jgi:hypothetical protein
MEPLYGILLVALVAVVVYSVAAIALVRRNKEPNPTWDRLKGLTWLAFAAAVVILLSVAAALVVTFLGVEGAVALILFGVVAVVLVAVFYMFLVHPLIGVLRGKGRPSA